MLPLRHVFFTVVASEALMYDEGLVGVCRPSVLKSGYTVKIMLHLPLVLKKKKKPRQTCVGAFEVKMCLCFGKDAS